MLYRDGFHILAYNADFISRNGQWLYPLVCMQYMAVGPFTTRFGNFILLTTLKDKKYYDNHCINPLDKNY